MAKAEKAIRLEGEHRAYHRRLFYIFALMMILLFGGATVYRYSEQWRYLDALYFSTATMTTIGYGDFSPKTDFGKIFTIFFAFASVGIGLYGLSLITAHFVEAREEFWLAKIGKIKIGHHTNNFWGKIKNVLGFSKEKP